MHVFTLHRCEEYWMEKDHGIFISKRLAIEEIGDRVLLSTTNKEDESMILVTNPDQTVIRVVTKEGDLILDLDELQLDKSFNHYSLTESKAGVNGYDPGYDIWGIFRVKVVEEN